MKTTDLIKAFIEGAESGSNEDLRIEGNKIFSNNNCLAEASNGTWYINATEYDSETSKKQSLLTVMIMDYRVFPTILYNIPENTKKLSK